MSKEPPKGIQSLFQKMQSELGEGESFKLKSFYENMSNQIKSIYQAPKDDESGMKQMLLLSMIKAQQQELLIESAMEQLEDKVRVKIESDDKNFIVNTKMVKSLSEIFHLVGKTLLRLNDEEYQNLVLVFKDKEIVMRYEDTIQTEAKKQKFEQNPQNLNDMLLFHLVDKNYLEDHENGESEQEEDQNEPDVPEIKVTYHLGRDDIENVEMDDQDLIKMFSTYWGYLMFMKNQEVPKDIKILKKRESKALTKMQLKRLQKKTAPPPPPEPVIASPKPVAIGHCTIKKSRTNKTIIKEFIPN